MKNKTPVIGQTLYSLNVGNTARNREQKLTPVIVTKVGRKYFSAMEEGRQYTETQFHIDGWGEKTEFSANIALYESEQEWLDEKEFMTISRKLSEFFNYGWKTKLTLQQLRDVNKIIFGDDNDKTPA